jgi:hypothetical protein
MTQILSAILDDVLPLFDEGANGDGTATVKLAKLYHAMKGMDMLRAVNVQAEKRRLLDRGEGQPRGRPPKK